MKNIQTTKFGYKLIIVGAGMTGLSTAIAYKTLYPEPENRVLVIEKNPIPGGCVSTFARKGYKFDTTQIIPDISELLDFFDVKLALRQFTGYYARLFLADTKNQRSRIIPIPSRRSDFEKLLISRYPSDKQAIIKFFNYCQAMHDELKFLKTEPRWYEIPSILFHCPKIIANSGKTYAAYLRKFRFKNEELLQVLDTFSSFSGLSGDRCAALLTACAMITTLRGSFRPDDGFIKFPITLMKRAKELGVEFRFQAKLENFLFGENKIGGIKLSGGESIQSESVVSTIDTKETLRMLKLSEKSPALKRWLQKAQEARMSPSGFSIQLGIDEKIKLKAMGFDCGYNVLTSSIDAHSQMFDAWEKGELRMDDNLFHLAVIAPDLGKDQKQSLIIHVVPAAAPYWIALRESDYSRYQEE